MELGATGTLFFHWLAGRVRTLAGPISNKSLVKKTKPLPLKAPCDVNQIPSALHQRVKADPKNGQEYSRERTSSVAVCRSATLGGRPNLPRLDRETRIETQAVWFVRTLVLAARSTYEKLGVWLPTRQLSLLLAKGPKTIHRSVACHLRNLKFVAT